MGEFSAQGLANSAWAFATAGQAHGATKWKQLGRGELCHAASDEEMLQASGKSVAVSAIPGSSHYF